MVFSANLFGGTSAVVVDPQSATSRQIGGPASGLDLLLDLLVESGAGKLRGHTNCVLDRVAIGGAVTHDGNALEPEQRRAAVLGVIEALLEILKCSSRH